jgi:hypothetical protein
LTENLNEYYKKSMKEIRRLYLSLGDQVMHKFHPEWGHGEVIESMDSEVPGGLSMVRVSFRDGDLRTFNNNIDSVFCCYYAGLRRF